MRCDATISVVAPFASALFIVALASGGRPHPRVGGLKTDEIKMWDGQR